MHSCVRVSVYINIEEILSYMIMMVTVVYILTWPVLLYRYFVSSLAPVDTTWKQKPVITTMSPPSGLGSINNGSERYWMINCLIFSEQDNDIWTWFNHVFTIQYFNIGDFEFEVWSPCFCLKISAPEVNWDELGFSIVTTDFMYVMKCAKGDKFSQGSLLPYGNIEISPSAGILNYGQVHMPHISA